MIQHTDTTHTTPAEARAGDSLRPFARAFALMARLEHDLAVLARSEEVDAR